MKTAGITSHEKPGQGRTNDWLTPSHILDALGPFDLDPCASEAAPTRCAPRAYTWRENGLVSAWAGLVWCNPPYGPHVGKWLARCVTHGNALALVFVRTDTPAMQHAIASATAVLFLAGRLTFVRADGRATKGNGGGGFHDTRVR